MKQSIGYTIGNTESYNKALNEHPHDAFKMGKRHDYDGGCVWKTIEEAKEYLASKAFLELKWPDGKPRDPKNFSVYAVTLENGWDVDVEYKGKDADFDCLKKDSQFYAIE